MMDRIRKSDTNLDFSNDAFVSVWENEAPSGYVWVPRLPKRAIIVHPTFDR